MKTRDKILFATALIAVAGLFVYAVKRHKKTDRMLSEIADEGYETASDLLFPNKARKHEKLRYGPVLPS